MKPLSPEDQIPLPGVEPAAVAATRAPCNVPQWVALAARVLSRYRLSCRGIAPAVSTELLVAELTREACGMPGWLTPDREREAYAAGREGIRQSSDKAERVAPGFTDRAAEYMRDRLAKNGPTSGELLVDLCKLAGMVPADDRAFGAAFLKLKRYAEVVGTVPRVKGHGTAGARVWKLKGTPHTNE